ncbi:MAG TPA: DUF433 domain-containing protein [Saprospiraceae bacterium]|nr:DUF433 domain-containing protein [Saprospiraceae bacterium]HMQ81819.1 DUF433 domain-containing protein [Saprospiraceae bacterium]
MDWRNYIGSNPEVMYGKPVLKGTRIPVDIVLEKLSFGEPIEVLLESYPTIKVEHIYACLSYAVDQIRNEEVYLLAS